MNSDDDISDNEGSINNNAGIFNYDGVSFSKFYRSEYSKKNGKRNTDQIPLLNAEERFRHRRSCLDEGNTGEVSYGAAKIPRKSRRSFIEYLEYEVQSGDTLLSVSIRFGVSTTELKQANNWFSDQDFFAQKKIKIPAKPYSILSEHLSTPSTSVTKNSGNGSETGSRKTKRVGVGIGKILDLEQTTDSNDFLYKMDLDLAAIREKTKLCKDSLDDVVASLNTPQIGPLIVMPKASTCNGADCGISWWSLLLILFVIGILVPLCYVIYLKTATSKDNKINIDIYGNQSEYNQT